MRSLYLSVIFLFTLCSTQSSAQTFACGSLYGQSVVAVDWGDKFWIREDAIEGENKIVISNSDSGLMVLLEYKRNGSWFNSSKDGSKITIEKIKRDSDKYAWAIRQKWSNSADAYGVTNDLMLLQVDGINYSLFLSISGNSSSTVIWKAGTYLGQCKQQS
jgi:hypothetical protein